MNIARTVSSRIPQYESVEVPTQCAQGLKTTLLLYLVKIINYYVANDRGSEIQSATPNLYINTMKATACARYYIQCGGRVITQLRLLLSSMAAKYNKILVAATFGG